jgi:hypothetical protein
MAHIHQDHDKESKGEHAADGPPELAGSSSRSLGGVTGAGPRSGDARSAILDATLAAAATAHRDG